MHNKLANPEKVSALMRQGMSAKQAVKAAYPSWSEDRVNQFVSKMGTKEAMITKESTVNKLELYLQKEAADKKDAKKYLGRGATIGGGVAGGLTAAAGFSTASQMKKLLAGPAGPEILAEAKAAGIPIAEIAAKMTGKNILKVTAGAGLAGAALGTAIGGTALGIKHLRDKSRAKKGKSKTAAIHSAAAGAVKEEAKATLKMKLMALLSKGGEGAKRYAKSATGAEVRAAKREGAIATKPLGEAMRDLSAARKQMWKDVGKGGAVTGIAGGGTYLATKKKSGGKKKAAMVLSSSDNRMFISGMKQASASVYTGFDKYAAPAPGVGAAAEKGVGWLAKLMGWGKKVGEKATEQTGKLGVKLKDVGKEGTKLNRFGKHMAENKKLYAGGAGIGVGAGTLGYMAG